MIEANQVMRLVEETLPLMGGRPKSGAVERIAAEVIKRLARGNGPSAREFVDLCRSELEPE